jgi:transcriptional regulator with XRE-family HTH domain
MSEPKFYPALLILGHTLRELRIQHDVSLRTMARRLGFTPASLSAWETGFRRPPAEALGFILGHLQVQPPMYRKLVHIHRQSGQPSCIEELAPDEKSLERAFEEVSVCKFEWAPHNVPDILQTAEYIRAKLQSHDLAPDDIDQAVFAHQVRELDRPKRCPNVVLVGEAAWTCETALPRLENLEAGIVPTSAAEPGTIEGFTIYESEAGCFTVVLRHEHARMYLGDTEIVKAYRSTFARLQSQSADCVGASR